MKPPNARSQGEGLAIYDTVTGLLREVPHAVARSDLWAKERRQVDIATGEVRTTRILNVKGGPSLTLHEGGLLVERSLPKALNGQNIVDLTPDELPAALAVVDGEVWDALRVELPPIADWDPVRVDYCQSLQVGGEAEVLRRLDRLASTLLPYKGLPVVGQNHGVRWPKGTVQPKFYGKYLETRGDPRALGILRSEASAYRLRTFRGLSLLPEPTLGDVLTPAMHERVWAPFAGALRGAALSAQELSDMALVREMVGYFGARRTAALMGYSALLVMSGCETRADMLASDILEFRTKYRVLADLRAFRAAMHEKGITFGEATEDEVAAVRETAALGRAA